MNASWTQIDMIHMTVQTADFQLLGKTGDQRISLSCALTNIARGTCQAEITPAGNNVHPIKPGSLLIQIDRRVMRAKLLLATHYFENLLAALSRPAPRPATASLLLADSLTVNIQGDLHIEQETEIQILDISFNFPTR